MKETFTHPQPGEEVRSISGFYRIVEEGTLEYGAREILYVAGAAQLDNACCGPGGCLFVRVAGYLLRRRISTAPSGAAVSEVEAVAEHDRPAVTALLLDRYPHAQVLFNP